MKFIKFSDQAENKIYELRMKDLLYFSEVKTLIRYVPSIRIYRTKKEFEIIRIKRYKGRYVKIVIRVKEIDHFIVQLIHSETYRG